MTREEAITYLNVIWNRYRAEYEIEREILDAYNMAMEALQAEPKRGTWTITETYDCEVGEIPHLICSECKSEPMAWSSKRFFNYCPNCGAKMYGDIK